MHHLLNLYGELYSLLKQYYKCQAATYHSKKQREFLFHLLDLQCERNNRANWIAWY